MTCQQTVDSIQSSILKSRELEIKYLETKRNNLNEEIEIKKDYLEAYKKTVPTVFLMEKKN